MEKHEIFNDAIEKGKFEGCDKEDLMSIGIAIGGNHVAFKDLYTAYFTNEARFEHKPRRGAKIEVEFKRSKDEVLVTRLKIELKFSIVQFLEYLNLLMLCFGEIYPLGSVVELDEMLFTKEFMKASGVKEGERSILAVITGRFVPVNEENDNYVIEYVATPYPAGDGITMFLNKVLIKGVIHSGYSDESEVEFVQKFREEIVLMEKKSIAFLTDDELGGLVEHTKADVRGNLVVGEVS